MTKTCDFLKLPQIYVYCVHCVSYGTPTVEHNIIFYEIVGRQPRCVASYMFFFTLYNFVKICRGSYFSQSIVKFKISGEKLGTYCISASRLSSCWFYIIATYLQNVAASWIGRYCVDQWVLLTVNTHVRNLSNKPNYSYKVTDLNSS